MTKGNSPLKFEEWKAKASEEWQPSYGTLQNPEKADLHEALLRDQQWACCYCGQAITTSDSHIEHFCPQDLKEELALDYANIFASCIRELTPHMPLHCGHAKKSNFDEAKVISPLNADCEARFSYALTGHIMRTHSDDVGAGYMIGLLALDIVFLQNRRSSVLHKVFSPDFLESMTVSELNALREGFRKADPSGRAINLGHVVSRYAEQRLADDDFGDTTEN